MRELFRDIRYYIIHVFVYILVLILYMSVWNNVRMMTCVQMLFIIRTHVIPCYSDVKIVHIPGTTRRYGR